MQGVIARDVPSPILAWHTHATTRPYHRALDAYYQIAKKLVTDKYPSWLMGDDPLGNGELARWPAEKVRTRAAKMDRLFFFERGDGYFDERRWRSFIRRVARHLQFVDRRRGIAAELGHLDHKQLNAELEYAERTADQLMSRAAAIRAYMEKTA